MTKNTVRLIQYNRWKSFSLTVSSASILLLVTLVGEYIFLRFYLFLFLERGEEREKGRERKINVWLLFVCPLLGPWPATQACALTGNQTGDPLVFRQALNPLSHTSRGWVHFFSKGMWPRLLQASSPVRALARCPRENLSLEAVREGRATLLSH